MYCYGEKFRDIMSGNTRILLVKSSQVKSKFIYKALLKTTSV